MTYLTLLVDMQSCSQYETDILTKVIGQQLRVLQFSREMGFTVFVTNLVGGPEIIPELRLEIERGRYVDVPRVKPNAFIETGLEYLFKSEGTTKVLLAGKDRDICCLETVKGIARSKRKVVTSLDLLAGSEKNLESLAASRKYRKYGTLYQSTEELIAAVQMEVQP